MRRVFATTLGLAAACSVGAHSMTRSESMLAEMEIRAIAYAAEAFFLDYSKFPPNDLWLAELAHPSNAVVNTRRILYLEMDESGSDPWGKKYNYRSPGIHNTNGVDVWSVGLDGESVSGGGDIDDINNWDKAYSWRQSYNRLSWSHRPTRNLKIGAVGVSLICIALVLKKMRK